MHSPHFVLVALVALSLAPLTVHAAEPPAPAPAPIASAAVPKKAPRGLAVVALGGATDAAWALAREVYANVSLRPVSVDDARARVLAGEAPAPDAPADVRDLSQLVAAVKGDDAASRQLLAGIAAQLGVRGVVVVDAKGPRPSARVFVADTGTFDAASYAPDDTPLVSWNGAVQSLARSYAPLAPPPLATSTTPAGPVGPAPTSTQAPALAVHDGPRLDNSPPSGKKFYESGWFWGAIGAAVFAGGALYFATRDNQSGTIHLQMQAPK